MYAADTNVSVEKSRAEIETILGRYGAARFAYMTTHNEAVIGFEAHGKFVKFTLPIPQRDNESFWKCKRYNRETGGYKRNEAQAYALWEQACRSLWRALCLCIKAKLEAVACGITSFEQEFLAHFVTPGGDTIGQRVIPQLNEMAKSGRMPVLCLTDSK